MNDLFELVNGQWVKDHEIPADRGIDGAFYAYARIPERFDAASAMASAALAEAHVAMTPGLDFDLSRGERFMRLSYAGDPAAIAEAIERRIGVPVVTGPAPSSNTPDRICAVSLSRRWVTKRLPPGFLWSSHGWMSASVSGSRGGQPSITQPIAGPWLSPQVVTRNRWPKVLCDMARLRPPDAPASRPG